MAPRSARTDTIPEMRPGMRPGMIPPFHDLGEYVFQDLCRDLFEAEPSVAFCDVYGTRGQRQAGIDILAHRSDGDGIEVGQCRCYRRCLPYQIKKASQDFYDHLEEWRDKNVRRFILFVACDLSDRAQQDEIIRQRQRFAQDGIAYEAWSAAKLRNELRPRRGIVATYCKPEENWLREICGEQSPTYSSSAVAPTQPSSAIVAGLMQAQLEQLASFASAGVDQQIEAMRNAWREGRRQDAVAQLKAVRGDSTLWSVLSPEVKARLLRLEASLELDLLGTTDRVRQLAAEAHALLPSAGDVRLTALIALRDVGVQEAVDTLAGQEDVDSINLRAVLLVQAGRTEECLAATDYERAGIEPNAETFRVRALARLVRREVGQARLEIAKAVAREPKWESMRWTTAIVDYFSSLSPAALPDQIVPWPWPIDWPLVKRDDESLQLRRGAAEVFRQLIELPDKSGEELEHLQAWRLACIANDPDRQEEAIEYCRTLLRSNHTHHQALAWATARNFEIDLKPSEKALQRLVCEDRADVPHILALVACYLSTRRIRKARDLLAATQGVFERANLGVAWTLWNAKILLQGGMPKAALKAIDEFGPSEGLRHARTRILRARAKENHSARELLDHLESSYQATEDPLFLLEACEWMFKQNEWAYVAERATELVDKLATGDVLGLAATAAYNARQFDLCLTLLDGHRDLFRSAALPGDLRRLRIACQRGLGLLSEAMEEAEALARAEPTTDNLLSLAQICQEMGDLKGVALAARRLVEQPDLSAEDALRVGWAVHAEDGRLATSLWRKAVQQNLPDDAVGPAVGLAYQLGLDKELGPLTARMAELGREGRGGIQLASIDDMVKLATQHRDRVARLTKAYRNGTAPIHLIAGQLRQPLVTPYHQVLSDNESKADPIMQPPLLARHGSRPLESESRRIPPWTHLFLDVTAYLLAGHLGILDSVETAFGPLGVPDSLVPALLKMRQELEPPQPARLQASRQVIDLVKRGSLRLLDCSLPPGYENSQLVEEMGEDWVALFERARATEGYLVDYLPLRRQDLRGSPSALPEDASECLVNCRGIVEALRQQGPFSDAQYAEALRLLGTEGQRFGEVVAKAGSPLFLHGNIPIVLADANLLEVACNHFEVYAEAGEIERIRQTLDYYERAKRDAGWLDGLIERLREGITKGTYQPIPFRGQGERVHELVDDSPDVRCLLTLLETEAGEGDAIWIDDRHATGYSVGGTAAIVTITDVLQALVNVGSLDSNGCFATLNRLRAANVRFIPTTPAGILHHLKQARVQNGEVVETTDLSVLRRYLAACLAQGDTLQRQPLPPGTPNPQGEMEFVLGLGRSIAEAIGNVWAEGGDPNIVKACSNWILGNLYLTHLQMRAAISMKSSDQEARYLTAASVVGLITQGVDLDPRSPNGGASVRGRYLVWLDESVLHDLFSTNPGLVVAVADLFKTVIVHRVETEGAPESKAELLRWISWFIRDLPEPLMGELGKDTDFIASIGEQILPVAEIYGLQFHVEDFWRAASEAVNGREVGIVPIGQEQEVVFVPAIGPEGRSTFYFIHPNTQQRVNVVYEELELLSDSPEHREHALRQRADWLDEARETAEQTIAELVTTEDPWQRVNKTVSRRDASATVYYDTLQTSIASNKVLTFADLMPPNAEGLLRHFRLQSDTGPGETLQGALADAAGTLLGDGDLVAAFERLGGIPALLPLPLIEAFTGQTSEDRRRLVKQLLRGVGSPLSKIHLVRLLLSAEDEKGKYSRLARRIVRYLLSTRGKAELDAFLAILKWTNNGFDRWPDARTWPGHIRLAMVWAHAHRLFLCFARARADLREVQRSLDRPWLQVPTEWFERREDYWFDAAHPRRVTGEGLLLGGLSYALGEKAAEVVDQTLRHLLRDQVFTDDGHLKAPALPLLQDPTRLGNGLGSFLGRDRCDVLLPITGVETSRLFARSSLEAAVLETIARVRAERDDVNLWLTLHAILGDLPPTEAARGPLSDAWREVDLAELFRRDDAVGLLAVQTISTQVNYVEDEALRARMAAQVVEVARMVAGRHGGVGAKLAANQEQLNLNYVAQVLFEACLGLAVVPGSTSRQVATEFAKLVAELCDACPTLVPVLRPMVERFCKEFPISLVEPLSQLLIRLRAKC